MVRRWNDDGGHWRQLQWQVPLWLHPMRRQHHHGLPPRIIERKVYLHLILIDGCCHWTSNKTVLTLMTVGGWKPRTFYIHACSSSVDEEIGATYISISDSRLQFESGSLSNSSSHLRGQSSRATCGWFTSRFDLQDDFGMGGCKYSPPSFPVCRVALACLNISRLKARYMSCRQSSAEWTSKIGGGWVLLFRMVFTIGILCK